MDSVIPLVNVTMPEIVEDVTDDKVLALPNITVVLLEKVKEVFPGLKVPLTLKVLVPVLVKVVWLEVRLASEGKVSVALFNINSAIVYDAPLLIAVPVSLVALAS